VKPDKFSQMLLGYDIGSSGIKACIIDPETGKQITFSTSPVSELPMDAPKPGWAEQDPEIWWKHLKIATQKLLQNKQVDKNAIRAIGIGYQMHGLVLVDERHAPIRPAIIWSDGRAVETGRQAFKDLGKEYCLTHFLNSPGNFTASKLAWVKQNEPENFGKVHKFMLPGDYIAMKLTDRIATTVSGLSEGILWDFEEGKMAKKLLDYYEIPEDLVPEVTANFDEQGTLTAEVASELGLKEGITVTYRAGDQPNNALSLNAMNPGEIAANAGTSGVIYGVTDTPLYDDESRVNTFVHVNHTEEQPRYGVLLCINGTGIMNSWLKKRMPGGSDTYEAMNKKAAQVPVGADGLVVLPFGNGPERMLNNTDSGARFYGINFNRHETGHLIRAAQEGIAFSLTYGLQIMKEMGMDIQSIRAGAGNMFLSPVFREALCNSSGLEIELFETSGAQGAAIGAGMGAGVFESKEDAFAGIEKKSTIQPDAELKDSYEDAYENWKQKLKVISV
jgi:xylulokinase